MANSRRQAIAVYAAKGSVARPATLREIASEQGYRLFFLGVGGYPSPGKEREFEGRLRALGASAFLVGIPNAFPELMGQFEPLLDKLDPKPVAEFLTKQKEVVWFEMTASQFDYGKKTAKLSAVMVARFDAKVAPADLPALRSAKSVYVLNNTGKRGSSRKFMASFADALAQKVDGVVGDVPRLR